MAQLIYLTKGITRLKLDLYLRHIRSTFLLETCMSNLNRSRFLGNQKTLWKNIVTHVKLKMCVSLKNYLMYLTILLR